AIDSVPSIRKGNDEGHAIGLGQMNLHGYLARERIHYGSAEGIDFTNIYFCTVLFHALSASNALAQEKGTRFKGFEDSTYADGSFFSKYVDRDWLPETDRVRELFEGAGINVPSREDWSVLCDK
ncbi:ribonucleotide-diphosphate reductase subunit alpha, partial [Pseudomonas sp. SIMBA_044]